MRHTPSFFISTVFIFFLIISSVIASQDIEILLPKGVSIELPRNWVVYTKSQRISLDTWVKTKLDLAPTNQRKSQLAFAANLYEKGSTIGKVNIRYYPKEKITQNDIRSLTEKDINLLDTKIKKKGNATLATLGAGIVSWKGTQKFEINGINVLLTEYVRSNLKETGNFRVRLVRVLSGNRSFTLTVSYDEGMAIPLKNVADGIIDSLRLSNLKKESLMAQIYGDNPVSSLAIAVLFTWGIGLFPPLIIRFLLVRRDISKKLALIIVACFWLINFLIFQALGSTNKTHAALILIALVSYAILRKGVKKPKAAYFRNIRECPSCGVFQHLNADVCENCGHNFIQSKKS